MAATSEHPCVAPSPSTRAADGGIGRDVGPALTHVVAMVRGRPRRCQGRRPAACWERIMWPLPRARDMTVPAGPEGGYRHRGGGNGLFARGRGARHDGPPSPLACLAWPPDVAAGGRCYRPESAECAPLARAT